MPLNEQTIENELQAKGLNAPRLTPAHIDDTIAGEAYHRFEGTTVTVCALVLRNGFVVIGESAAASPENFDPRIGEKIARDNARQKIWGLEGYLLRERLSAQAAEDRGKDQAAQLEPPYPVQQQVHAGSADPRLPAGRPHP